jgi:hypothetical protein
VNNTKNPTHSLTNRLITLAVPLALLGGCSTYDADLDCGVSRGKPCRSLSSISDTINQDGLLSQTSNPEWTEIVVIQDDGKLTRTDLEK